VNRTVMTVLRAIVGLIVLFVLLLVVMGWWREYKDAPTKDSGAATTTQTPSPAAAEEGSGGSATEPPSGGSGGESETLVVLVDGLNLRVEPQSDAKAVRGLNKGERLVLVKKDGKWYQVKTSKGDAGWISSNPGYTRTENP